MFFRFILKNCKDNPELGKFLKTSKLIGIIIMAMLVTIIVFSLIEMHINHDLSCLSQITVSIFALAGVYVAFYLTMAKVEHVEAEITSRQEKMKECGVTDQELIDAYSQQVQQLNDTLNQLINREDRPQL